MENFSFEFQDSNTEVSFAFVLDPHLWHSTPSSRRDSYPEAILKKFQFIFDEIKPTVTIVAGDMFHSPVVPDHFKKRVVDVMKDKNVYVIPGNHDFSYYNIEFLNNSSLGLLVAAGVFKWFHNIVIDIGGTKYAVVGQPFGKTEVDAAPFPKRSILVAHAFLNIENEELTLTAGSLAEKGYQLVVLGHDHIVYEPLKLSCGTVILRGGALSRFTSHDYNHRSVGIFVVTLTQEKMLLKYVNVPSEAPDKVYSAKVRFKHLEHGVGRDFDKRIGEYVLSLLSTDMSSSTSVKEVLQKLNPPVDVANYLTEKFYKVGLV